MRDSTLGFNLLRLEFGENVLFNLDVQFSIEFANYLERLCGKRQVVGTNEKSANIGQTLRAEHSIQSLALKSQILFILSPSPQT